MRHYMILLALALAITTVASYSFKTSFIQDNDFDYDMYVFAVQWGSTMCVGGPSSCKEKLKSIPKNNMSVHGLWPSLKSGARLPDCHQGTDIPIVDDGSDIFLHMREYWPSLNTNTNEVFWGHEFNKHGYCYATEYTEYFQRVIDLLMEKKINTLILDIFGEQPAGLFKVPYEEFVSKLEEQWGGKYFGLVCKTVKGVQYLQEMRLTLDFDFNYFANGIKSSKCSKNLPISLLFN